MRDDDNGCDAGDGERVLVVVAHLLGVHEVVHDHHVQKVRTVRQPRLRNPHCEGEEPG